MFNLHFKHKEFDQTLIGSYSELDRTLTFFIAVADNAQLQTVYAHFVDCYPVYAYEDYLFKPSRVYACETLHTRKANQPYYGYFVYEPVRLDDL